MTMILELLELYEGILGVGVIAGIAFLLYSGDFVVIHRRFLWLVAIGTGITTISRLVFLSYWSTGIHWSTAILFAHLVFILFIVAGFYSLVTEYPVQDAGRLGVLFR
jgi:hypothetical protein